MAQKPVTNIGLTGLTEIMKDYFADEKRIRHVYFKTREETRVLERNEQYEEGETVYSELIPDGFKMICVQSGTSGENIPEILIS